MIVVTHEVTFARDVASSRNAEPKRLARARDGAVAHGAKRYLALGPTAMNLGNVSK